jgi:tetratricopeptide (TPR) repeat protein
MSDEEAWRREGDQKLNRATEAWQGGNREEAEQLLNELIDEFPDRPEAYNKLGVILAELGSLDMAEHWFRTALAADSDYPPALTNLGNIILERGRVEEAMSYYGLALERDPEYAPAHRNLAVALRRQGDLRGSVRHLKHGERLQIRQDREKSRRRLSGQAAVGTAPPPRARGSRSAGLFGPSYWWLLVLALAVLFAARYLHLK